MLELYFIFAVYRLQIEPIRVFLHYDLILVVQGRINFFIVFLEKVIPCEVAYFRLNQILFIIFVLRLKVLTDILQFFVCRGQGFPLMVLSALHYEFPLLFFLLVFWSGGSSLLFKRSLDLMELAEILLCWIASLVVVSWRAVVEVGFLANGDDFGFFELWILVLVDFLNVVVEFDFGPLNVADGLFFLLREGIPVFWWFWGWQCRGTARGKCPWFRSRFIWIGSWRTREKIWKRQIPGYCWFIRSSWSAACCIWTCRVSFKANYTTSWSCINIYFKNANSIQTSPNQLYN